MFISFSVVFFYFSFTSSRTCHLSSFPSVRHSHPWLPHSFTPGLKPTCFTSPSNHRLPSSHWTTFTDRIFCAKSFFYFYFFFFLFFACVVACGGLSWLSVSCGHFLSYRVVCSKGLHVDLDHEGKGIETTVTTIVAATTIPSLFRLHRSTS